MNEAGIELALVMGWTLTKEAPTGWIGELPDEWWRSPEGDWHSQCNFDPFTDANDCESLIRYFNELPEQWSFDIQICSYGTHAVEMWMRHPNDADYHDERERHGWEGDDWKQGVCELALKVLGIEVLA